MRPDDPVSEQLAIDPGPVEARPRLLPGMTLADIPSRSAEISAAYRRFGLVVFPAMLVQNEALRGFLAACATSSAASWPDMATRFGKTRTSATSSFD
jgi:hypothetical protein